MKTIEQELPLFRYQGRVVLGTPWLFAFGKTGRVDGDLVLDDGNIVTARQVLDGAGPEPLTKAARRVVSWVKQCAPKWVASSGDDDYYSGQEQDDPQEECSCRKCKKERKQRVPGALPGCSCAACMPIRY